MAGTFIINNARKIATKTNCNLRKLRLSLKYRPEILKLILKMKQCIKKKNALIKKLKLNIKSVQSKLKNVTADENINKVHSETTITESGKHSPSTINTKDAKTRTVESSDNDLVGWGQGNEGEESKSIADQVKEVAQSALQETGMVYVETAGMYYDYKTGYYYNTELGLYYHTDTGCYYTFSDEKQAFEFHSYPDHSAQTKCAALEAHEKKKARKHKKEKEDEAKASKPKRKKKEGRKKETKDKKPDLDKTNSEEGVDLTENFKENLNTDLVQEEKKFDEKIENLELEDGECSETESEASDDEDSVASTATASDEESIAKHLPPCMRVIVRETDLPKLKVGSLFLITKDGGTVGREGEQHTILIKDTNVSRIHLDIKYDTNKGIYTATDLGSKNGTILNGIRMSESQETSQPIEVPHGSTIQMGETKLLCHIHPGNDTCGHCEPGLIMEAQEKENKQAYTRTCSVQKQHQLELARLKNKYAPKLLEIEATAYNDRAQLRREAVGSSHSSEKTVVADLNTSIAPENKGFKLLEKMGWSKGEGLGKDCQGDVDPIPMVSNEGKAGLGTAGAVASPAMVPSKGKKPTNTLGSATLRLANRTKMLQPPAKAFQSPIDDDSD